MPNGPGCAKLGFQDLSIVSAVDQAFEWWGAGSASYSNIELTGGGFAWWDYSSTQSQHYWWNSVLNSTSGAGSATFQTYGAVHRFYGGEVNLKATGGTAATPVAAVNANSAAGVPGEIQMYGSAIRAKVSPGATLAMLNGVNVGSNQTFHLHGGTIAVDATAAGSADVSVRGIQSAFSGSNNLSTVHVLDVGYVLKPKGLGTADRLYGLGGPGMDAPFYWGAGTAPPQSVR